MKLVTFAAAALLGAGAVLGPLIGAAPAQADKMCGSPQEPVQVPDWYQCEPVPGAVVPPPATMHGCSFIPFPPFPVATGQPCPWGAVDTGRWP